MRFREKREIVNARILSETIRTEDGETLAEPGDWLISGSDGQTTLCKAESFARDYEAVDGPNPFTDWSAVSTPK